MKVLAFLKRLSRLFTGREAGPLARSSTPLRLCCPDIASVPPVDNLARLTVAGRHVVLQFPPPFEEGKRQVAERLAGQLPGHSVFDSGPGPGGTTCVTVLKVIDEHLVLENLPLFLAAIRDFANTAHGLCRRLADARGIRPEELLARRVDIQRSRGNRLGDWTYCFHGLECCFTDRRTGQVVDVRTGFGGEFGVLGPYFLARFIRTTPAHREAAQLLSDDFHDPCRMVEILEARGHLRVVEVVREELGGMVHRGLALDPADATRPGP